MLSVSIRFFSVLREFGPLFLFWKTEFCLAMSASRITCGYFFDGFVPAMNRSYDYSARRCMEQWDYYLNTGYIDKSVKAQFTTAESATFTKVYANVDTYMSQNIPKFITGALDVNGTDWDNYCKVLNKYSPKKVTAIYQRIFDEADEQIVELVVGPGVAATGLQVQALGSSGNTTGKLYDELGIPNTVLSDGPAGLNLSAWIVQLPDGSVKGALIPENIEAYKRYLFGFNRIAMLSRMAKPEQGTMHYQYATAWPCSQLLAQSFDPELLYKVGDAVGREMEQYGVTIWLAPGMNIHRNPLCGRTFEYYSEDPLVSGKMAAAIVRGVQSHPGKGMSVKHFVANNCELNRNRSSSNLTEKTLREIYLRGFEIAVKESNPMTVMASYNKVNGLHVVNNYDLLAKVLRNEWGFRNTVISDWDSMKVNAKEPEVPLTGDVQKAQANQMDLVCPGRDDQKVAVLNGLKSGKVKRSDLERSATRILRMIRANTEVPMRV